MMKHSVNLGSFKKLMLFFLIILTSFTVSFSEIIEVDFDESLGISNMAQYKLMLKLGKKSEDILSFYRDLYNKNKPSKITASKTPRVPKIIHQIWIGPASFPELYNKYRDTCLKLHPDWEYKLWTDKDVENWDFASKDLYNKAVSYQEKADILRYEILYKYGGLYLDTDCMCIAKFDELNHLYDFYAGIEPPSEYFKIPTIAIALIGTKPNNQIFKLVLENIRSHWNSSRFEYLSKVNIRMIPQYRTMQPLTIVIYKMNPQDQMIILPPTYFYPIFRPPNWSDYTLVDQIKILVGEYKHINNFASFKPESMASHDFFEPYISPQVNG